MKKYKIIINETLTSEVEEFIEAESEEEAVKKAWDKYFESDDDYILDYSNLTDTSIEAHEII